MSAATLVKAFRVMQSSQDGDSQDAPWKAELQKGLETFAKMCNTEEFDSVSGISYHVALFLWASQVQFIPYLGSFSSPNIKKLVWEFFNIYNSFQNILTNLIDLRKSQNEDFEERDEIDRQIVLLNEAYGRYIANKGKRPMFPLVTEGFMLSFLSFTPAEIFEICNKEGGSELERSLFVFLHHTGKASTEFVSMLQKGVEDLFRNLK